MRVAAKNCPTGRPAPLCSGAIPLYDRANTTATVYLPAREAAAVTEGGKGLTQAKGIKLLRMEADQVVLATESGTYRFEAKTSP